MLRAFFLIFTLVVIAWLAVFGFRGQKSSRPEIEIFPDMVRQPKGTRAGAEQLFRRSTGRAGSSHGHRPDRLRNAVT